MKFRIDKHHISMGLVAFVVIVCAILFYLLLTNFDFILGIIGKLLHILMPIIWGLVIAYLLNPVLRFFEHRVFGKIKWKKPRPKLVTGFSIAATLFVMLLIVAGLLWLIIPQVLYSVRGILAALPDYISNAERLLNENVINNPAFKSLLQNGFSFLEEALATISAQLSPRLNDWIGQLTVGVVDFVSGFTDFVIGIIVSVYVMASREKFAAQAKKLLYAFLPDRVCQQTLKITRTTNETFGGFLSGKLLDSLIIGLICFIVMALFRWEYPVLISVVIGVFNIIPFFGPVIGAVPCLIILLLANPMHALFFLIFILLLQTFDGNILGPKILGEATDLSPFWVIFAILVGGGIGGIVGMFVAVPVFSVIYSLFCDFVRDRLAERSAAKQDDQPNRIEPS